MRSHYVPPFPEGPWHSRKTVGCFHCSGCFACTHIITGKTFISHNTNKTFHIKDFISCWSSGVIYLAICPCGLEYTGKTSRNSVDEWGNTTETYVSNMTNLFQGTCGPITPLNNLTYISWGLTSSLTQYNEGIGTEQNCSARLNGFFA